MALLTKHFESRSPGGGGPSCVGRGPCAGSSARNIYYIGWFFIGFYVRKKYGPPIMPMPHHLATLSTYIF